MYKIARDIQFEIVLELLEIVNFNQAERSRRTGKPVERIKGWKEGKHLPSFRQLAARAEKLGYNLNVELVKNRE